MVDVTDPCVECGFTYDVNQAVPVGRSSGPDDVARQLIDAATQYERSLREPTSEH
jgi:hypothetical protein